MMEKNNNIFNYCGMILTQYGVTVIVLTILVVLVGDEAAAVSTMFSLGAQGISIQILGQFLALTILCVGCRCLFFTDYIIKKLSMVIRTGLMMLTVLMLTIVFIILFQWFPVNNLWCWLMFLFCVGTSTVGTILVLSVKEKLENKKLEEALKSFQEGEEKIDGK